MTARLGAAKQISMHAPAVAFLWEWNGSVAFKDKQQAVMKVLVAGRDVFGLPPTGFGKSLTKHRGASREKVPIVKLFVS